MLLKDNPIVNYKKETFNSKKVFVSVFIASFALIIVLAGVFLTPFITINHMAYSLSNDEKAVSYRIQNIEDKKSKLNKGENYLIYNGRFFTHPNSGGVPFADKYERKFSNVVMDQSRTSKKVEVTIKKVPDISCNGFAEFIKSKYGNVQIKDVDGKEIGSCPSLISSLFSVSKYNLTYTIN